MNKPNILIPLAILICLLLAAGGYALPAELSIPWWTADSGGGQSNGGQYTLHGTTGQPDGGLLTGGQYTLSGGFWGGPLTEPPPGIQIYLPITMR